MYICTFTINCYKYCLKCAQRTFCNSFSLAATYKWYFFGKEKSSRKRVKGGNSNGKEAFRAFKLVLISRKTNDGAFLHQQKHVFVMKSISLLRAFCQRKKQVSFYDFMLVVEKFILILYIFFFNAPQMTQNIKKKHKIFDGEKSSFLYREMNYINFRQSTTWLIPLNIVSTFIVGEQTSKSTLRDDNHRKPQWSHPE